MQNEGSFLFWVFLDLAGCHFIYLPPACRSEVEEPPAKMMRGGGADLASVSVRSVLASYPFLAHLMCMLHMCVLVEGTLFKADVSQT